MSIKAGYLVAITPRTISAGASDLETNGMLLTKSALLPSGTPAMAFASAAAVAAFFGDASDEAVFAQQYFTGLTNQQKAPTSLVIGRRIDEDAPAWIRGGAISADLAAFKKVTDGAMKITIDGAEKSAKRFKRWVTSEVLPAIRKNGHYEVATASNTLSSEEQYEIRKAVKSRAKNSSIHYQTIYNALYDYFKIASYKDLTKGQLQAALTFIHTCELKPQLTQPEIPEGALVLEGFEAERIAHFVYYWRYLFRPDLELILRLLQTVNSPKAAQFYEAVTELHLPLLEMTLEKHGYSIKEMSCYKHLVTQRN